MLAAEAPWSGVGTTLVGLLPGIAAVAAVSRWQRGDEVYRLTSNYVFGPQTLLVFWYPLTLGAVGFFAVRGWRRWIGEGCPAWVGVTTWTVAVILLHTSPVLGGYHFAFHLHAPICLAAASGLLPILDRLRARPFGRVAIVAIVVLLFQTPLTLTWKCVREIEDNRVRPSTMRAVEALAPLPPGNVRAAADVGLYVPAYTDHRVYAGHWFLTPSGSQRAAEASATVSGLRGGALVHQLVDAERIRYVVTPAVSAPLVAAALESRVAQTLPAGQLDVLVLDGPGTLPAR